MVVDPALLHPRSPRRKPWRKLLWVRQDYPDNWVDQSFLQGLQRNVNVQAYNYWLLVRESAVVTQHLSSIAVFISAFICIYTDLLRPPSLIWASSAVTAASYGFWDSTRSRRTPHRDVAVSAMLIVCTILGLSPILKSLTRSTTSDSIWALAFCLFLANILFHDYSAGTWANIKFPGSLATNAAIMASVVLASRLPSTIHVFSLMLFAVEWFALFPIFRRYIRVPSRHVPLTPELFVEPASSFNSHSPLCGLH